MHNTVNTVMNTPKAGYAWLLVFGFANLAPLESQAATEGNAKNDQTGGKTITFRRIETPPLKPQSSRPSQMAFVKPASSQPKSTVIQYFPIRSTRQTKATSK
jgi:hypothetical protein